MLGTFIVFIVWFVVSWVAVRVFLTAHEEIEATFAGIVAAICVVVGLVMAPLSLKLLALAAILSIEQFTPGKKRELWYSDINSPE
jgi:hypothetical protein